MTVSICKDKQAPIIVHLKLADIQFSIEKAQELRDKLDGALKKYKTDSKAKQEARV